MICHTILRVFLEHQGAGGADSPDGGSHGGVRKTINWGSQRTNRLMANAKIDKMAAKSAKTLMMAATHTPSMSSPRTRRRFMARSPRLAHLCTYGTWLIRALPGGES